MAVPLFKIILIETLNVCTRDCWFCKFGQERQDPGRFEMSWDTIEQIVYTSAISITAGASHGSGLMNR
jgi:2-iminoacetate synthase ThiH